MIAYLPQRGDVVRLSLNPQVGHEQAGRRPCLVLSSERYNRVGLAIICPLTKQSKGYPFEVPLPDGLPVTGVVLSDQAKSLDWRGRNAEFLGRLPTDIVDEVFERVVALIQP